MFIEFMVFLPYWIVRRFLCLFDKHDWKISYEMKNRDIVSKYKKCHICDKTETSWKNI